LREVADLPTLIFVDYWMPLQTGLELATQLRQHPSLSAIPVALLTGQSQLAEQSKGIWRVYQKPSSVDDLHRLIDQAIHALLSDK
jgi:CheY-like chemotaxis protein